MKRLIKIGLSIIGSVIALLVVILTSVICLVDPNDYKAQIAHYLSQWSGRNLIIAGDIHFTCYPWLGLNLGQLQVGNAPDFTEPTFAQVDQAQFQVKLLPLLKKQLEVGHVLLAGIKLTLIRKADGHTNWEDLLTLTDRSESPTETGFFDRLKIAGLEITQGELTWDDRQTRSRYVFSDFNLNTAAIIFNQPIDLKLHSTLAIAGKTTLQGQLDLTTQLTVNFAQQLYQLTPLKLVTTLASNQLPLGQQSLSLHTEMILDLKQQHLMVSLLSLQLFGIDLTGQVNIHNRWSSPIVTGQVAVTPFNPKKLLQRLKQVQLGLSWISLFNQSGLSFQSARLKTQFQFNPAEGIQFNNLELQIDNNRLKTSQLNLNWQKETLVTRALSLTAFGIPLNAQVEIEQVFSQPVIQGQLSLLPFNPKSAFEQLKLAKINIPAISLPNDKIWPLQTASLATQFRWRDHRQLDLANLHGQVDNNHFQTAHLQINLSQETLEANNFSLQVWETKLVGKMQVKQLLSQPQATVKIAVAPFNLPALFKRLGIIPPSLPKPLTLTLASLTIQLRVAPPQITLNHLHLTVDENQLTVQQAQFNWSQNILNLEHVILKLLTASIQGKLQITQLLGQPQLQGSLKVDQINPRQWLLQLGQPLPTTTDPTVLTRLTLETTLQSNLSQLVLNNLTIHLDDSQLIGNLEIKKFNPPAINFHLNINNVDIDRYLPPQSAVKTTQPQLSPSPQETLLDFLRALNLNGTLKINHFKAAQLTTTDLELVVAAQ
ncbi:MAG: AsmA family protein [Thioploca sp.]|nr:AsmA family protein [Thioploca sp.]